MKKVWLFFLLFPGVLFAANCPIGMVSVEYDNYVAAVGGACPAGYVAHDAGACTDGVVGACWAVRMGCGVGVPVIKTSTGVSVPLYADQATMPAIHVKYNGVVCYADLNQGTSSGAINVRYNNAVYHTGN
ncbi:MAG: hypothetical protein R8M37_03380 [Alphaproteobacteria bacterium]|nr:hypothetical protein [Alphaproteobacteria bacterium]